MFSKAGGFSTTISGCYGWIYMVYNWSEVYNQKKKHASSKEIDGKRMKPSPKKCWIWWIASKHWTSKLTILFLCCWKFLLLHHQLVKNEPPGEWSKLNLPKVYVIGGPGHVSSGVTAGGSGLRKMFQKTLGGLDILWWQNTKSWNNLDTYPPWN